ncbi:uncharacterized protein LOC132059725 isoform X3 [Lycium ferocissimum]|uniref:uncharacterized protein LOC132059725 isoform X3 n=1 Tax=Lycium ferocissimum TaxID=112874 RepID=UPI00281655D5|nr:uncharacterized protein LOC132059725 isoform X3 [Lycium ferocissimum]
MTELSDGDTSETKSGGLSSGGFSSGLVVACDPHPAVVSLLIWKLDFSPVSSSRQLIWILFAFSHPLLLRGFTDSYHINSVLHILSKTKFSRFHKSNFQVPKVDLMELTLSNCLRRYSF